MFRDIWDTVSENLEANQVWVGVSIVLHLFNPDLLIGHGKGPLRVTWSRPSPPSSRLTSLRTWEWRQMKPSARPWQHTSTCFPAGKRPRPAEIDPEPATPLCMHRCEIRRDQRVTIPCHENRYSYSLGSKIICGSRTLHGCTKLMLRNRLKILMR